MATTSLMTDLSRRVRRIAEVRADEPVVISCYVSLEPSEFPTRRERDGEIESLVRELRAHDDKALSHDARNAFRADIDRIEEWTKTSLDPEGVHGVAIFASAQMDMFEVFGVAVPVGPLAHVDRTARLQPLIKSIPAESWCVFVVDRRNDRIFRGNRDRLDETASHADTVHGQHDQGGWSQARYQRSVEKEVKDHVRDACDRLFESYQKRAFDKLLIAAPQEMRGEVEQKMHSYLLERLVGYIDADLEAVNGADITERARSLIEQDERRRESELVERLSEQLGRNDRAASGLGPVMFALNERGVDVLFLAPGFTKAGFVCPKCEWLDVASGACPADSTPLQPTDDIIELAARSAVLQSAPVHELRYHEPERALGADIAALLRF